jgi:hypothetical protein
LAISARARSQRLFEDRLQTENILNPRFLTIWSGSGL